MYTLTHDESICIDRKKRLMTFIESLRATCPEDQKTVKRLYNMVFAINKGTHTEEEGWGT